MTYYLLGKAGKTTPPTAPVSPVIVNAMETVNEEDESHDSPTSKSDEKTVIDCNELGDNNCKASDEDVFLSNDLDGSTSSQPLINNDNVDGKESFENTLLLTN